MTVPHHTLVKICGITRLEDAQAALEAGADWLGFIVKGESPRRVSPERAREISVVLSGAVTVAVMVSPTPEEALQLAGRAGADRVQLHRVDAAGWPPDFPVPASFSVPVAEDGSITVPLPPERHLVLLDTAHDSSAGGTGETFPWETARVVAATRPVVLAGGLDGENVGAAITRVRPYGVDASSRLEAAPGVKDPAKMRRFVTAVRTCDRQLGGAS
jgi:phosphoribosylanthranilate isomerase